MKTLSQAMLLLIIAFSTSKAAASSVSDEILRNESYLARMPYANQKLYLSGNQSELTGEEKTALLYSAFKRIKRYETWEYASAYYNLDNELLVNASRVSMAPLLFGRLKDEERDNLFCYQTKIMKEKGYAAYFLFEVGANSERRISKIVWHWGDSLKEDLLCGGSAEEEHGQSVRGAVHTNKVNPEPPAPKP